MNSNLDKKDPFLNAEEDESMNKADCLQRGREKIVTQTWRLRDVANRKYERP